MRFVTYYIAILTFFSAAHTLVAGEIITLFVRAYPTGNAGAGPRTFNCDLHQPGKIAEYCLQGGMRTTIVASIFFSYAGFLDITDMNGQVTFPRKQLTAELQLLITDKITPIPVLNHTIGHWELETGTPAKMYSIKRDWDENARLFYWTVGEMQLPNDKKIPLTTIIMFAKPRHVYVPLGVTLTTADPNLILPDIYVRQTISAPANAMYLLNLRQFFGPIGTIQQTNQLQESFHLFDWGHEIR